MVDVTITEAKAYTLRGEVLVREGAPSPPDFHRLPLPAMAQGSHQPAKARHYGPSFQQLLLLAFLLIAGLLGTSAAHAVHAGSADDRKPGQRRPGSGLNVAAQTLNQRGQALERAARQSLVLGDAQLRQEL